MTKKIFSAVLVLVLIGATPAAPASLQTQAVHALSALVRTNAPSEDVYDFVDDVRSVTGVPILLESSVKHDSIGITLGIVSASQAIGALCQRFGWIGYVTGDGMLDLGPGAVLQQRMPSDAQMLPACDVGVVTTQTFQLRYRTPSELAKSLQNLGQSVQGLGGVGGAAAAQLRINADDDAHVLIVEGSPTEVQTIGRMIATLDVPTRAVQEFVTVYDFTPINNQANLGLEFDGLTLTSTGTGGTTGGGTSLFSGTSAQVNATFDALIQKGHATVISQPSLGGLDNQKQDLQVGSTFFVTSVTNAAVGAQSSTPYKTGVIGDITPHVGVGFVTLDASLQVSSIGPIVASQPTIDTQQVTENIRVPDGQAIVIAGLMSDSNSDTISKIPGIGDIPVLGGFFRHREMAHVKNQLVFVIEPHILEPVVESSTPPRPMLTPAPTLGGTPQ